MPSPTIVEVEELPTEPKFDAYAWVDYIELLCLLNDDREISKDDVISRIKERRDLGEGIEEEIASLTEAERKDIHHVRADSLFRHLDFRQGAFGEFYPFEKSSDGSVLHAKTDFTLRHKFYIYLLVSSNLRYVSPIRRNTLTTSFEFISAEALKKFFSDEAEVHIFGTNAVRTGRYGGTKWEKICRLKEDINEELKVEERHYSSRDLGDQGLDLVAWMPLGDRSKGLLLAFAQCACTKEDWSRKQDSSSRQAWNSTLTFMVFPTNLAFIPFCFRDVAGDWHKPQDIHESVVIDRLRLLHLLREKYTVFERDPSFDLVEEILTERETLV